VNVCVEEGGGKTSKRAVKRTQTPKLANAGVATTEESTKKKRAGEVVTKKKQRKICEERKMGILKKKKNSQDATGSRFGDQG